MVRHILGFMSNGLKASFEAIKLQILWWLPHMQLLASDWGMNYSKWRMTDTGDVSEVLHLLRLRDFELILAIYLSEVRRSILIVSRCLNPRTLQREPHRLLRFATNSSRFRT